MEFTIGGPTLEEQILALLSDSDRSALDAFKAEVWGQALLVASSHKVRANGPHDSLCECGWVGKDWKQHILDIASGGSKP